MGAVSILDKIWLHARFGRILKPMQKFAVLLVDDHRILLEGVKGLIRTPFEVTATASSGHEALTLLKTTDFDLMITDYEMPGLSGAELIKGAKSLQPDLRVIVLSMHDDVSVVRELLRAGAQGYILKKDTHKSLTDALQKVMEGKRYLSDEIAELLIQPEDENKGPLTERETEILRLIAKEYNSRQIAEILFISERTVEKDRSHQSGGADQVCVRQQPDLN